MFLNLAFSIGSRQARIPLMFIFAVIALTVCHPVADAGGFPDNGCEPQLPLDITWTATTTGSGQSGTSLSLVLTAQADLATIRMELLLPEQVSLLSGAPGYQGRLRRGEETLLTHRITGSGPAKLQVRVTAMTPAGLVFTRGATLQLGADGQPMVPRSPGRLVNGPDGQRPVREFQARPVGAEVGR